MNLLCKLLLWSLLVAHERSAPRKPLRGAK
jgi:hypothetical protein